MKVTFYVFIIQLISSMILMVNSHILTPAEIGGTFEGMISSQVIAGKKVKKSVVIKDKNQLWGEGIIPYQFEDVFNASQRRIIAIGMQIWEESTCIKFIERDPDVHPNYVAISKLDCGCCYIENIQRNKGRNELSLNDGCDELPIVLHELGHVLGFYHEHEHPDRDQYIYINEHNVERGYRQEFGKFSSSQVDTLGRPYDYRSIMHYPRNAFARYESLATIVPKQSINGMIPMIGNKIRLSDGDISATNTLYNCSNCIRTLYDTYGSIQSPIFERNAPSNVTICEWRLPISRGGKVALKILNLNIPESSGCMTDYLEIRKGFLDSGTLLGRYCGKYTNLRVIDENMLVKYVRTSESNDASSGFIANYYKTCTGSKFISSNDSIILQSPNYPYDYEPNTECSWDLTTPRDHETTINFDLLSLEPSDNCANDYVEIGTFDDNGNYLYRYCGEQNHRTLTLKHNKFFFHFMTNGINESAGFSATITTVPIKN